MIDLNKLEELARAATPQNFDSAEERREGGEIECPHCNGEGSVAQEVNYVNYDDAALGVQFYGIGNEHGAAEAFYRAASPANVLELIASIREREAALAGAQSRMGGVLLEKAASSVFCPECHSRESMEDQPVARELPSLPDPEWPAGEREAWRLGRAAGIEEAAKLVEKPGGAVADAPLSNKLRRLVGQPVQQPAVVETIGKHKPFESAAKSLHQDWTPEKVHHLIDVVDAYVLASTAHVPAVGVQPFQQRVQPWMMACFGAEISADKAERNHRFFEEATELVQSTGMTASEAHQLVDYVYGRDIGEPAQEVGGVMVTLAALCLANDLNMHDAAEVELARIWTKVEAIRAKQAAKPKHSPLPQAATVQQDNGRDAPGRAALSAKVASYPDIPEGWQLVPKQPTPEMIGADFVKQPSDVFVNESVWRAMLAAAPAAPCGGGA